MGVLLDGMHLEAGGRLAVLSVDRAMMARTGAGVDDIDGLINLPLQVREHRGGGDVQARRLTGTLARQPAIEGRRSTCARSPRATAAAATATPRGSTRLAATHGRPARR